MSVAPDCQDSKVQGVLQEVLELTAEKEKLVHLDCLGKMENRVNWDLRVFKVCLVCKDHQEKEERRVQLEEMESMEDRERQGHKAHGEATECQENQDLLAEEVQMVNAVHLENEVHLVHRALLELLEFQEKMVRRESVDLRAPQDQLEHLDQGVIEVVRVNRGQQDHEVFQERGETLVQRAKKENRVSQERMVSQVHWEPQEIWVCQVSAGMLAV